MLSRRGFFGAAIAALASLTSPFRARRTTQHAIPSPDRAVGHVLPFSELPTSNYIVGEPRLVKCAEVNLEQELASLSHLLERMNEAVRSPGGAISYDDRTRTATITT